MTQPRERPTSGRYGTSMFKGRGGDRFNPPRSITQDVEVPPVKGLAEIISTKKGSGWVKTSSNRFGPEKKPLTADHEISIAPGMAEQSTKGPRSSAFVQTTPRMGASPSPNRQREDLNTSIQSTTDSVYSIPTFVDDLLKSKKGSTLFKGNTRFGKTAKAPSADVAEIYSGGGIADTLKGKGNPMKAGGHAPRFKDQNSRQRSVSADGRPSTEEVFTPRGMGDIDRKKAPAHAFGGSSSRFTDRRQPSGGGPEIDYDLEKYSIAGQAQKQRGKGCWSKRSSSRLQLSKPTSDPQEQYVPKPFGSDAKAARFNASGPRFYDPHAKNQQSSTAPGYYEQPTFVDLILKK